MVNGCVLFTERKVSAFGFRKYKKKYRKTELYILFKNPSCEGELLYWSTDIISEIAHKLF